MMSVHGPPPSPTNLGCFGESLCNSTVSSSVACGDEVGHTAALQEGGRAHLTFAEQPGKSDHFHQAQSDHCRLGVVAKTKAVAESGADRHNILSWNILLWITLCVRNGNKTFMMCDHIYLQSATQLHRVTLLDNVDAEVWRLKELFEDRPVHLVFCS